MTHGVICPLESERDIRAAHRPLAPRPHLRALGADLPHRHSVPREEVLRNHATNRTTPRARDHSLCSGLRHQRGDSGQGGALRGNLVTWTNDYHRAALSRGAIRQRRLRLRELQLPRHASTCGGPVGFGHSARHEEGLHAGRGRRGLEGCTQSASGRALETVESPS